MQNDYEVLILCGGEGKRLRSMISDIPKPMAPIGEKPFLDYLVKSIEAQGFKNFCFLTGYKSEIIFNYVEKKFNHLNFRFSNEDIPLGTGGAIIEALKNSKFKNFIVVNGDTYFDIDLKSFVSNHKRGTFKIALRSVEDAARYGRVEVDNNGTIVSFIEKGAGANEGQKALINGGIYAFDNEVLLPSNGENAFVSLENDIFPKLLPDALINSQIFNDDFIDIGIPEDYIRAQVLINKWSSRPR